MIYTLTLNPSIDYVVQTAKLNLGQLNKMDHEAKFPGGKGINVSRILHELNYTNTALGFLGGFTGDFIANQLEQQAIKTDFTPIKADTRINIKLKSAGSVETEINGQGPRISPTEADQLRHQLNHIDAGDTVILSGSAPPTLPANYYQQLIQQIILTGASFVIDTTGEDLRSALSYEPLLVKPNLDELGALFGVTLHTHDAIIDHGKKLLKLGAKHAIVSMAGEGALLFTTDGVYKGQNPDGEVKNSVGAGDSMIAGFTGQYHATADVIEAFRMGLASGSATAFSTDLARAETIHTLRQKVRIDYLSS